MNQDFTSKVREFQSSKCLISGININTYYLKITQKLKKKYLQIDLMTFHTIKTSYLELIS